MTIYHRHHIIPTHMGGTDDPENLVELTIEEHAEAHRILYEKHGLIQDYCAWKGLSGQIGKDEILKLLMSAGGKRGALAAKETLKRIVTEKLECQICGKMISHHNMSRHLHSCTNGQLGTKGNATRKGMKINHPGWKNHTYVNGSRKKTICITDGQNTKRIEFDHPIPEGWRLGRHYNPKA